MKILMVDPCQARLPIIDNLIRADTDISIPLAEGLARKKHTVFFLTSHDSALDISQIKAEKDALFSVISPERYYSMKDEYQRSEIRDLFLSNILMKCVEVAESEQFDLIHIHSDRFVSELELLKSIQKTPIVVTLHSVPEDKFILREAVQGYNLENKFFISISNNQRILFPYNFAATVYNGTNTDVPFGKTGGEDMLFVGRLRKIKGILEAIQTSLRTKRKLVIHGKTSVENDFVENTIKPLARQHPDLLSFLGYAKRKELEDFYPLGKLILLPIQWEEPFGLVGIEAMASGTPVIAFAKGAMPEIVLDGKTGFIVNASEDDKRGDWIVKKTGIEGLVEAVEKIYDMSEDIYREMRKACRKHVETRFSIQRMVDDYENVYKKILEASYE